MYICAYASWSEICLCKVQIWAGVTEIGLLKISFGFTLKMSNILTDDIKCGAIEKKTAYGFL